MKSTSASDSEIETIKHIQQVRFYLNLFAKELVRRGVDHDASKLESPEKEGFDAVANTLKDLTYGSDEYKQALQNLKPTLDHHYANNSHHPEHFPNGISGMNLLDLVEMYFDWCAAVKRSKDGNILKSISINEKRFNLPPELVAIFNNTAKYYEDNANVFQVR